MPLSDKLISACCRFLLHILNLYTGWVQHDAGLSSNGLWGKISSESASDNTVGSVSPAYLAPVDSVFVSVFISDVSLCDKGNSLSEVKVNLLFRVDASDLQQTDIVVLVAKSALEAENGGINVKTRGSLL